MSIPRSLQFLVTLLLLLFIFANAACSEETEANEQDANNKTDKTADPNTKNEKNTEDNKDKKDPEVDEESAIEKLQKKYSKEELAQIREEIEEHKDIENPKNSDKRYEYVKRIVAAQKKFITFGLEMVLDGMYQRQQTQKDEQAVFNIIYGYFLFVTSRGDEGRKNRGVKHIKKALELDSNFEYGHFILGSTYLNSYMTSKETSLLNAGIEEYKKALKLRSDFYDVHRSLGQAYMEMGDTTKALEEFNSAIKLNKDDSDNWIALIVLYFYTGEHAKAEKAIEEADVSSKVKYQAYGQMCLEFQRKEQFSKSWAYGLKAFEHLKKVESTEIPKENWIAFYILMANLALKKAEKETDISEQFIDKVFEVDKTNFQAIKLLMTIAYDIKSIRLLEKSIQKWMDYIELEPLSSSEENMVYDFITLLARILVELAPQKIEGNKELVLILLKWALSVRGDEESEALKKAGKYYLTWMFPLEPDPKNKDIQYISEKNIKIIENPDDLKLIIAGLFRAAKSDELRILKPAVKYLGAIVRAAKMDTESKKFVDFITETFALPATSSNNRIKSNLCISLRDYYDPTLVSHILSAMKLVVETESTSECHRYFPNAHETLNILLNNINSEETIDKKLRRRQFKMLFYQDLYKKWADILDKRSKEEAEKNSDDSETKPESNPNPEN